MFLSSFPLEGEAIQGRKEGRKEGRKGRKGYSPRSCMALWTNCQISTLISRKPLRGFAQRCSIIEALEREFWQLDRKQCVMSITVSTATSKSPSGSDLSQEASCLSWLSSQWHFSLRFIKQF